MNNDDYFKALVNKLIILEKYTDSCQGLLCLITDAVVEKRKYIMGRKIPLKTLSLI